MPIDVGGCSRAFLAVSLVAAVLALVLVSRLTVFMIDPARTGYSTVPSSDFEVRHSCLTAYFVAADVVRRTPNVYDTALYAAPDDDPTKPRKPQMMGIFRVDQYRVPATVSARATRGLGRGAWISATPGVVVRVERPRAARGFARRRACDGAGGRDARAAARASRPRLARHPEHAPERQRPARRHCDGGARDGGARTTAEGARRRPARLRHRREALSRPARAVPAVPARLARRDVDGRVRGRLRGADHR